MRNLRSYEREQLLAMPPGPELDELVHGIMGGVGCAPAYSKDVGLVGVMMIKTGEVSRWFLYSFSGPEQHCVSSLLCKPVGSMTLPHVCALALVLAAWEKEPK